jgi:alpha-tubulin suppressor-like RCC1 family protein
MDQVFSSFSFALLLINSMVSTVFTFSKHVTMPSARSISIIPHVTNCGNGWFSKIIDPPVNAREICEAYGYKGIDIYGGNSGNLCSESSGESGNCGWNDGNNCGQTVDWHCFRNFCTVKDTIQL